MRSGYLAERQKVARRRCKPCLSSEMRYNLISRNFPKSVSFFVIFNVPTRCCLCYQNQGTYSLVAFLVVESYGSATMTSASALLQVPERSAGYSGGYSSGYGGIDSVVARSWGPYSFLWPYSCATF